MKSPLYRQTLAAVLAKEKKAELVTGDPEFPAEGPKLASILDPDVPDKYTLTDHLWNNPGEAA